VATYESRIVLENIGYLDAVGVEVTIYIDTPKNVEVVGYKVPQGTINVKSSSEKQTVLTWSGVRAFAEGTFEDWDGQSPPLLLRIVAKNAVPGSKLIVDARITDAGKSPDGDAVPDEASDTAQQTEDAANAAITYIRY
jgi:hypothetical protein